MSDPRDLLDDALEILVVPSFSRIGFAVRRRLYDWAPAAAHALHGQTALVTGPTSGLGRVTAMGLAALGARVVLAGRDADRLKRLSTELVLTHGEDRFPTLVVDMASLDSVNAAAARIATTEPRLDIVVDNAGAIFDTREESPDGIERTLATMVVGPFALIAGLLPLLRSTGGVRVIAVTSGGMYLQRLHLDDLQWDHEPFDGVRAYARAKRAQVSLMREWARRIPAADVAFNAMHPGWADTPGIAAALPGFYRLIDPIVRTPAQGADTTLWLAAHREATGVTGGLFLDRRRRPFDRVPGTRVSPADRQHLWSSIGALAGVADPIPTPIAGRTPTRRLDHHDEERHDATA
jgi:dehydrogenase/reductase SDR family member 12